MRPKFKKSYLVILAVFALIAQAVAITTLHLKSGLIDHLIQKDAGWRQLVFLVALFAGLQVFGAIINVLSENCNRFFSVAEFKRQWNLAKPLSLRRHHINNHHKLFNGLYNNIPKLFGLHVSITLQVLTASVYASFFIARLIHDKFWIGLFFIPVIGIFSWGAGHLYSRSYEEGSKKVARDRVELSSWLELWFRSARERNFNWNNQNGKNANWYEEQGDRVADGIKNHAKIVFKRDVFGSLLVDWPYILCVTIVLLSVVEGKLSIGEFLIWTTLIDYLMTAFSSTRYIKKCRLDARAIHAQLDEDLGWLKENEIADKPLLLPEETHQSVEDVTHLVAHFRLLSGETVLVSLRPGFYRIAGSNGSGKSTLMDTLIGFNDRFERWNPEEVAIFQKVLRHQSRIIERECVVFPELNTSIYSQIFGTEHREDLKEQLVKKIKEEFTPLLADFWLKKLDHLESLWGLRPGSLSSGEKVVLGFMRMLASLDQRVKLIAIDECDSVLDQNTAWMFQKSTLYLARKYAVWYVSHTYNNSSEENEQEIIHEAQSEMKSQPPHHPVDTLQNPLKTGHSYLSSVYLLGYERETKRGFVTPCQVAALSGGKGTVTGSGNVGRALADVLVVVKRAFIHTNENFRVLNHFDWQIDSVYREAEVGEIKSAGLALAIAMLDISRQLKGMHDLRGYAGTGHVLLDGSVVPVAHVEEKLNAVHGLNFISKTFSFKEIKDLNQLATLLLFDDLNKNAERPVIHQMKSV